MSEYPIMGDAGAVQKWFGIGKTKLYELRASDPDFPMVRFGKLVLYDFKGLTEWLKTHSETK